MKTTSVLAHITQFLTYECDWPLFGHHRSNIGPYLYFKMHLGFENRTQKIFQEKRNGLIIEHGVFYLSIENANLQSFVLVNKLA